MFKNTPTNTQRVGIANVNQNETINTAEPPSDRLLTWEEAVHERKLKEISPLAHRVGLTELVAVTARVWSRYGDPDATVDGEPVLLWDIAYTAKLILTGYRSCPTFRAQNYKVKIFDLQAAVPDNSTPQRLLLKLVEETDDQGRRLFVVSESDEKLNAWRLS